MSEAGEEREHERGEEGARSSAGAGSAAPRGRVALGSKARRALVAKLPPLPFAGGQILDVTDVDQHQELAKALDLTADDFLDPLWERVHGRK